MTAGPAAARRRLRAARTPTERLASAGPAPRLVRPLGRPALSARMRILGWFLLLLGSALVVSVLVTRAVMVQHIVAQVDSELHHEVNELRALAGRGTDAQGRPFPNVAAVLQAAVGSTAPESNATLLGYLNGQPFVRSAREPILRLDTNPQLTALWGRASTAYLGTVQTAAGQVRYAVVPVTRPGDSQRGVVVAALFVRPEMHVVTDVTTIMIETGLAAILVAFLLAWLIAGRILAPVRHVTELARTMSGTDLTRRLPVRGRDEISELAMTFNGMLERLELAFRAQRAFVDDAGHELRTPITIIRGNLEMLANDGDDPVERRETLALVTDELDRMSRMVTELLTLAKSQQPDFVQLDVQAVEPLTREMLAKAETLADRQWELDQAGSGTVVGDRQRLTQAVLQLAQNAVQHTKVGALIAMGSSVSSTEARFWVRDTGPGVPVADRQRIFARFARAGHRRTGDGAGLGLAIVRSIAEAHGGRVELDSTPAGATFTLVVRIAGPAEEPRAAEASCPGS